ncbi:hypothetical protein CANCADRAFT_147751 [Tortispora caseinolytica NRRL Y-17796]|uniref:mRNA 3'-end-processing protein n=1 Tax=Tortispora caseinolytica NRRL Y-17796 TaxID=767744 RepID=A0A1E4TDN2_9ASCO|nr:hypothetical protein CANCADRAFT_147751 [Tortispora caseinolytica NRRL Y-17796]
MSDPVATARSDQYRFRFEDFLKKEYRYDTDPNRPVCKFYLTQHCPNGWSCPDRHTIPSNVTSSRHVCKHWLRGLCKKGDTCDFLHEYNLRRMPECTYFARSGQCAQGGECLYLHIDPLSKIPECPNYIRGFCRLGPNCPKRHVRRSMCLRYLAGFCPLGKKCPDTHPKFTSMGPEMRIRSDEEAAKYYLERRANTADASSASDGDDYEPDIPPIGSDDDSDYEPTL